MHLPPALPYVPISCLLIVINKLLILISALHIQYFVVDCGDDFCHHCCCFCCCLGQGILIRISIAMKRPHDHGKFIKENI